MSIVIVRGTVVVMESRAAVLCDMDVRAGSADVDMAEDTDVRNGRQYRE